MPETDTQQAAAPLRTYAEIKTDFDKEIPAKAVKEKNTGKFKAKFVKHTMIRRMLDAYAPGWEWSIKLVEVKDGLYVIGTLTIHAADRSVSRDGVGNESNELDGIKYGDPSSNAEAQALRRAAMAHGLGRYLWGY